MKLLDLNGESVAGARKYPAEWRLHAIRVAIIRIVDLRWVTAERSFGVAHESQQQARFLVQIQAERRLALGAAGNQVSVMTIDFFANVDAEFLIQRLQVRRQVKIGIDACGGVFHCRHRVHTPGNTEPPLFPIKTSETVSALEMHDRKPLVRSLRINIDGKMLAAEYSDRSLLHAARDFLERIRPADGGEIFVE